MSDSEDAKPVNVATSAKLAAVMERIVDILVSEDVAGLIILHDSPDAFLSSNSGSVECRAKLDTQRTNVRVLPTGEVQIRRMHPDEKPGDYMRSFGATANMLSAMMDVSLENCGAMQFLLEDVEKIGRFSTAQQDMTPVDLPKPGATKH